MDRLSDFTYTMESCNHCGQCKWILGPKMRGWKYAEICPIHQRWHYDAYSGQGLINIAEEVLNGELAYEEGLIEHIYRCTTCGACDVNCKSIRDMEVLETILALRAKCVEEGEGPMAPHKEYARCVEEEHNIYGEPHDRRFDWVQDDDPSAEGAGMAYFVGCNGSYRHPEIARDTVSILSTAGLRFTLLGAEEYCCGAPLWRTGQIKAAEKQARHIIGALNKLGIKTVVTSSRHAGISEYIADGVDGILLQDPGNPSALAGSLSLLLQQPELRRSLGENAARKAQQFSWDHHADAIHRLLSGLPPEP